MAHERLEAKIEFDLNVVSPGQSSAWASNSSEASSNAAAEEEDLRSTSGAASLCFDNLRCPTEPDAVDDDGEDEGGVLPELRVVTRPLLPTAVVASTLQPPAAANSSSTVRRGDLGFVEGTVGCAAEAEARVLLHRQQQQLEVVKKSRRGPRSRSSQYRGVTFYRRTGRWESHIWLADASDCGKQVYLGGFDTAHAAARYAILFWLLLQPESPNHLAAVPRLAVTPQHPHLWNAYPGYFPRIESLFIKIRVLLGWYDLMDTIALIQERGNEQRPEVGLRSLPGWAWHMRGPTLLPLVASAASSGFSNATTTAAALPPLPAPPPPPISRHLLFPPPATTGYFLRN
ncbi:hypothetical protein GW17_00046629 [Ensete ventricosum]|nr:hypothetical protein GW17_00046629 [Ensete ventricosum]